VKGEIDEAVAGEVIHSLLVRDQESHDPIRLFIYSPGAEWESGIHICDTILYHLASPVITIAASYAGSSAARILACGSIRLALPKTKIMFHEVYDSLSADDVPVDYASIDYGKKGKVLAKDTRLYLRACTARRETHLNPCKMTPSQLKARINHPKADEKKEYIIGPRTALRFGFIDGIIRNVDGIARYERMLKMMQESEKKKRR
jgi:ATP-dependent protease ClpP protease subunit